MDFNVSALLCTIGCCLISLIIAGNSGSKADKEWFKNLNHPDNSFLLKFLPIIGFAFYLLLGFVLYHLIISNYVVSIIIVVISIQGMGLCPLFLYKVKNLKLFFFVDLIFPILATILIFLLLHTNLTLAVLSMIYLLWEIYDTSYYYRLLKLNK